VLRPRRTSEGGLIRFCGPVPPRIHRRRGILARHPSEAATESSTQRAISARRVILLRRQLSDNRPRATSEPFLPVRSRRSLCAENRRRQGTKNPTIRSPPCCVTDVLDGCRAKIRTPHANVETSSPRCSAVTIGSGNSTRRQNGERGSHANRTHTASHNADCPCRC